VGVAKTGFGKGHALLAIKELARRSGLEGFLGPGRWKSESAVRKIMEAKPTVCCLVDEMGGVMRDILGKKASEHKAGIRDIMLELFSAANTTYTGAEGASEKAVPLVNPNLCVYGASTPTDLWGNFNSGAAADGFLPRWLVFDVGDREAVEKDAAASVFDPPEHLRKGLHAILDARPRGNLADVANPNPIIAEWGAGALDYFRSMRAEGKRRTAEAQAKGQEATAIILSRAVEHAVKLSLIYAVSIDVRAPVITVAALEWAREVVEQSTAALVRGLEGKVADSDAQAEFLWVRNKIAECGPDGIARAKLLRQVHGRFNEKRFDEIVAQLVNGGEAWKEMRTAAGGGRPAVRIGMWPEAEREAG